MVVAHLDDKTVLYRVVVVVISSHVDCVSVHRDSHVRRLVPVLVGMVDNVLDVPRGVHGDIVHRIRREHVLYLGYRDRRREHLLEIVYVDDVLAVVQL